MRHHHKQTGLTMIELMIAITIFMIITGAVFSLYINSNRAYNEDEVFSRMQENGRFALNLIAQDLDMVDFWGEMIDSETITITAGGWGTDCTMGLATPSTTASRGLQYYNYASPGAFNPAGCAAFAGDPDGDGDIDMKANTNALSIKRVSNGPHAAPANGLIYLRTNGFDGELLVSDGNPPADPDYTDWLYLPRLYFIKEDTGIPYLCRAVTNGGTALVTINEAGNDCVAEGIEQMHIEFGIDTDADGVANRYTADSTTTDAVTARVYLLLRSARTVPDHTDSKKYMLGSVGFLGPYNDGYYRRVFSSTVTLRNPRAYIILAN